jgi:hypothetical protein
VLVIERLKSEVIGIRGYGFMVTRVRVYRDLRLY